ncbi:MAG: DUF166 family protein [Candidatus Altiarchaeota archaeon]|nr:DUF166 family protein [Candidatus Altiarchaeota archaeon]
MKKTTVAVIGAKGCAEEFIRSVAAHGRKTRVLSRIFLRDLPDILDDLSGLIPDSVFKADVVLDYSGHPDIPYALESARRVITFSKCSLPNTVSVDCLCSVDITEEFGIPVFKISVENGRINEIEVIKSSPCGASYYLAEKLVGMSVEEAVSKSGLLTQFTCKGNGGPEGSIHKAAEIHRAAIEKAVSI